MSKPDIKTRYKELLKEMRMKDFEVGKLFGYSPTTWKSATRRDKRRAAIVFIIERCKAIFEKP